MEALLSVTVLFTLVLALSLLIERLLEIFKALYDLLDSRLNWHTFWTRRTEQLKGYLEKRLRLFEYVKPALAATTLNSFREVILDKESGTAGPAPVLSGDLVRALSVKVVFKIIAIVLGISLAFLMDIDLILIWKEAAKGSKWVFEIKCDDVRVALSGVAMGLGSSPVHKLITTIEKKRKKTRVKGGQT